MIKLVNGVEVEMTPEEEAAWLAESEANDPVNLPPQADPVGERNGEALDARQIKAKKEEIAALLKSLTSPEADAIRKITELI